MSRLFYSFQYILLFLGLKAVAALFSRCSEATLAPFERVQQLIRNITNYSKFHALKIELGRKKL